MLRGTDFLIGKGKGAVTGAAYVAPAATYVQPAYVQPTYVQPAYVQPTYVQPAVVQPVYAQPAYAQPIYVQPTYTTAAVVVPYAGRGKGAWGLGKGKFGH
jgi:hypothetical protein